METVEQTEKVELERYIPSNFEEPKDLNEESIYDYSYGAGTRYYTQIRLACYCLRKGMDYFECAPIVY